MWRSARGVGEEVGGEAAGEWLGLLRVDLLPGGQVGEGRAVGRAAGGIDLRAFAVLAVAFAPDADGIVVFESEAGRVDGLMAARAAFVVAMLLELIADARRAANVRFDGGNARWWRLDVIAEDALINKDTAHHGRGAGAVGGDFEDRALGDEAAALCFGLEGDFLQTFTALESEVGFVVPCEATVEEGEVGVDEVGDAQIAAQQLGEVGAGFLEHGFLHDGIEVAEETCVGRGEVDLIELEPLVGEGGDEAFGFGVRKQPLNLLREGLRVAELVLVREFEQFLIGHGAPKGETEPRGDGVVVEKAWGLDEGQKAWRAQDGAVGGAEGFEHGISFLERFGRDLAIRGALSVGDRSAKSACGEAVDEFVDVFGFQCLKAVSAEKFLPHAFRVRDGIDAFDVDAAMRDPGIAFFFKIAAHKAHVAAFRAGGSAFVRAVVWSQFEAMVFFDPGFESHVARRRRGFDKADHVEQRRVRFAGSRAQRAPHRAIGGGIDATHTAQRDAIPTARRCPGGRAAEELQADGPSDALAVLQIGAAVVAAAVFGEHLGRVMLRVSRVSFRGAIKRIIESQIGHVEVTSELMMRELLAVRDGFKAMRGAIFRQQRFERDVDAEQIVQRVLILDPCEPPAAHAAIRGDVSPIGLEQRFLQSSEEEVFFVLFGLRLLFRRHLAIAHAFENALPGFEGGWIELVDVQTSQIEVAFLHICIMAFDTMPFEKVSDLDGSERGATKKHEQGEKT